MEDLVTVLKTKAGLTDEQSKAALSATMNYFKSKFPQVMHSELDRIAEGGEFGDTVRQKLEGVKDKLEDAARHLGEKAEGLAGELKEKFTEVFGSKKGPNPPSNS